MTAAQLIEILQKQRPDTDVLVSGYESGYDNIRSVTFIPVIKYDGATYEGQFEELNEVKPGMNARMVFAINRDGY